MVNLSPLRLQALLCVLSIPSAASPAPRATNSVPLPTPPAGSEVPPHALQRPPEPRLRSGSILSPITTRLPTTFEDPGYMPIFSPELQSSQLLWMGLRRHSALAYYLCPRTGPAFPKRVFGLWVLKVLPLFSQVPTVRQVHPVRRGPTRRPRQAPTQARAPSEAQQDPEVDSAR
ncbi:hypothetical protein K438DRAFT_546232 [Mycena galopus ATCC 62051]|nr:hypothetical protein K438DRAFT_546232 [Mycena galopus ATCC 62051]